MILVISVIVFLLLIGLSLVTITEHQRYAGTATAKGVQTENAVDSAVAYVSQVLDADWLETTTRALDDDPKLAAVQTINRRDENIIDGAGIDISDGTFRQITEPGPAWGVSATAALYRRAAIGERFFDERFFAYYEDVDLCARLHEEGWSTRVLPVIKATHRGSASASVLGKDALRLRTRNRYWVARRHRGVGRIGALLFEDLKKRPSVARIRGVWEGLLT